MPGDRYYITEQNARYFLTFTVVQWIDVFTRIEYKEIITESMNYCIAKKGWEINAWVLMTNHLHLICRTKEPFRISDIIRDFKKFTSKKLIQTIQDIPESRKEWLLDKFNFEARRTRRAENFKLWKDDNHALNLDELGGDIVLQKINYIHNNPVRAGIVANPEDYIYSSAGDYINDIKGLVNIEILQL